MKAIITIIFEKNPDGTCLMTRNLEAEGFHCISDGTTIVASSPCGCPQVATILPLSQQPEQSLSDLKSSPRSWPEDYGHENGNYMNKCGRCGYNFMGHKRRMRCKTCSLIAEAGYITESEPTEVKEEDQDELWNEVQRLHNAALADAEFSKGKPGERFLRGKVNAYRSILQLKSKYHLTRRT